MKYNSNTMIKCMKKKEKERGKKRECIELT